MRSLDECKAEIFHRSEVKIKQRKQMRNRIVAVCLPLCLCVGAVAAWGVGQQKGALDTAENMALAPESLYAQKDELMPAESENTSFGSKSENTPVFVRTVTVNGAEPVWEQGDQISPAQQLARLQELCENGSNVPVKQDPAETEQHRIVFTMSDDSQMVYILAGNALTEESNGKKVTLTQTELQELKLVLGFEQEELQ